MNKDNLRRLVALSTMVQDLRLAELSQAEASRQSTEAAIAGLDQPGLDRDLDPVQAGRVQVAYARWADVRRADLKVTLARQTAICHAAQAQARTAFGRNQALTTLAARAAADKPKA
jgi:hypothetical protein